MNPGSVVGDMAKESYRNLMIIGISLGSMITAIFYVEVKDSKGVKREVYK